ncbi:hypothetical protein RAH32_02535 [Paracoccus sp. WLY502]|uniref:hypothetical protein n=1 Tax=Paracoccus yibinensis TaxID=3068891 RepID=UPI0027966B01|nr:hypothetical protein [Paracoccus sp. WLY502]MDQ1899322.1 hypothetical protein [Paracoccus sp. WLY502]
MLSRLKLALIVMAGMIAGPLVAQPLGAVPPAPPPAIQRLAEGTLPIVTCPEDADRGCVEILFDGEQPPVACWTLPPFGNAAVRVETAPIQQIGNGTTRRMTIWFHPLQEVPPAIPATLHFGFPRAGAPLACDQTLVVQRPSSLLALPAEVDLGVLHADLFGRVAGSDRMQPVFPAPNQPAIGPLTVSTRTSLHAADRQGSPVPVSLELTGGSTVTASRFAELTLVPGSAGAFPALGALSGQAWITAPQLVQPFALTIRATSRIGWMSVLSMLVLGIVLGALVNRHILPRQVLARARLDAERAFVAAARLRDEQRDKALAQELDDLIARQRAELLAATEEPVIATAVQALNQGIATQVQAADARRQDLAAVIAPPLAALRTLPAVSELPAQPLDAWGAALAKAQALIEAGEIERPARLIETEVAQAERAALAALSDFAAQAGHAIHDLDRWTRDAAVQAFAPLQAAGAGFLLPVEATPPGVLTSLRDAHHNLRRAAATGHPAIARVLRTLAAGAANSHFPDAFARTEAILRDLDQRPVDALDRLSLLVQDYQRHARTAKLATFEDLADVQPSGVEGGVEFVPPVERRIELPEPHALAIETDPRLPVAGRDLTIRVMDLPAGHIAHLWTPQGSARFTGRDDPALTIRPLHPGLIPVQIVLADAQGHVLSRQSTTLTVQPAADHAIPALTTELRRADALATGAAAVLALISGVAVFSLVPLTSWWALLAPLLWGFFVNLNLPDAIQALQARRDAVFKTLNIG